MGNLIETQGVELAKLSKVGAGGGLRCRYFRAVGPQTISVSSGLQRMAKSWGEVTH